MKEKLTWEEIETINKTMTGLDIKGKNYNTVNERIIAFRKLMPNGLILPNIISDDDGRVLMSCEIYDENNRLLAKAHSYENENVGFINKTSYIENCYHKETEVLTESGFINIVDLIENNSKIKVAQVDLDTNELSFVLPTKKIIQENKHFIKIEDNLNSQIVTDEHFVIVDDEKIFANKIQNKLNNFKNNFEYNGLGIKKSDNFVKILQWVIADGYIDYEHSHIKFGFVKKRKYDSLIALLNLEGIEYTESYNETNKTYRINIKQATEIVKFLPRKTLTFDLVMSMNKNQAKTFIDEIQITDGCLATRGGIYLRQTDEEYFNNLILLSVIAGYNVGSPTVDYKKYIGRFDNALPIYRLRIKNKIRRLKTKITDYGFDTAYCLSMPKGTLVIKQDYKITVSSNCETSVIGRALGLCGFGIDNSVASAEEVDVAIQKQDLMKAPISQERLDTINDLIIETNTDFKKFCAFHKISSLKDINVGNAQAIESSLIAKKKKMGE